MANKILQAVSKTVFNEDCHTERSRSVTIQEQHASTPLGMASNWCF